MPLLEVRNLETEFATGQGTLKAVNSVSFSLEEGQTLGIVGETGSGKSVTALSIMRLISSPGRIASGEIIFDGENLLAKSEAEMRSIRGQKISMIFQEPMTSLNPAYTIGNQIAEVYQVHLGAGKAEAYRRSGEMLRRIRIPNPEEMLRRFPHEFSGGMRQRVMIAMALACRPKLLIADEPTTALDVTIQAQILDLLNEMRQRLKMSMIFISHDLGVVARVTDHIAVMYAGRIVEYGDKYSLFESTLHPYTMGLLDSIPRKGSRKKPLRPVPGIVPDLLDLPPGCPFHPRCARAAARCREERPALERFGSLHAAACFFPGKESAVEELGA
jgi:peptide/nickel transport system ATP-binding protein/oligopeptide transport system ATP-binding protein